MPDAVAVIVAVIAAEGRQNVVFVETGTVETWFEEFRGDGHRVTVVADSAETDMALEVIVLEIAEFDSVIGLRKVCPFTLGNRIHGRNKPKRYVASPDVEVSLDVDIGDMVV